MGTATELLRRFAADDRVRKAAAASPAATVDAGQFGSCPRIDVASLNGGLAPEARACPTDGKRTSARLQPKQLKRTDGLLPRSGGYLPLRRRRECKEAVRPPDRRSEGDGKARTWREDRRRGPLEADKPRRRRVDLGPTTDAGERPARGGSSTCAPNMAVGRAGAMIASRVERAGAGVWNKPPEAGGVAGRPTGDEAHGDAATIGHQSHSAARHHTRRVTRRV
jgi:hypothetical protein